MRNQLAAIVLASGLATPTFGLASDLLTRAQQTFEPIPSRASGVSDNSLSEDRVELGRMLFFDPRLSASGVISCHTCHNLSTGGDDNLPRSVGHLWKRAKRNAPTVFNAVYNKAQFWDGRAKDLKTQAKGPIRGKASMANKPEFLVATLKSMPEYRERFARSFPGEADSVSFDNAVSALEAFEATLITPGAPFDRFLRGDETALSDQEKRGLALFMDRGCSTCHGGINLGGQEYYPFGLVKRPDAGVLPPEDKGRHKITKTASDEYVFRAAPLRNVALTAPYFHSGQVWDLKEAVSIMGTAQFGTELTDPEADDITAFLRTLTGQPPRIEYPILPVETRDTPRPRL
jgi:cytochrome c peroxidase